MTKSDTAKNHLFQGGLFGGKGGASNQVVKSPSSVPPKSVLQVKWCSKTSDPQKKNIPMTRNCHHFALFEPLQKVSNICSIFYRKAQTNWNALQWSSWFAPHFCAFQQICALCIVVSAVHWLLPSTKSTHHIICSAAQFSASVCACAIHPQLHKLVHFKLYEDSVSAHLCCSLCNLFNVNFVLYRGFEQCTLCSA